MTTSSSKIFHSNDFYSVRVNDDVTGYEVINDASGVTEFEAPSLPECIFAAENMAAVLEFRTYDWIRKSARDKAGERAGIATVKSIQ